MPLECISENPDNFASVLAEAGRTLMLCPSGTISRPPPEPDSVVDSNSRKIFIYIPPSDNPFGGIFLFFGNYALEVLPLLQSHWTDASRTDIGAKLRRCMTLDAAVAECARNESHQRALPRPGRHLHGRRPGRLVSPGDLLLDDQDDEPAPLNPLEDDEPTALDWSHGHHGAQLKLEQEMLDESAAQAKLELKRETDNGTVAALAAQTEALNAPVGLIGARESTSTSAPPAWHDRAPATHTTEPPPPSISARGHSGRFPQCQTPGCTKER